MMGASLRKEVVQSNDTW